MTLLKSLVLAAAFALLTAIASAQPQKPPMLAVFCEGPYALCIKAPCVPVVQTNGTVKTVVCSCTVEQGWSMGPAACVKRKPLQHGSTTHLMSTYSNYYNTEEQTMTCKSSTQQWANCYGAPCVTDSKDPKRAHCNCPVWTGEMLTLGGKCDKGRCDEMWSAATPAQNTFANQHYYTYMKQNHPLYPAKPPAKICGAI